MSTVILDGPVCWRRQSETRIEIEYGGEWKLWAFYCSCCQRWFYRNTYGLMSAVKPGGVERIRESTSVGAEDSHVRFVPVLPFLS